MRRSYAPSKVSITLSETHSDENRDPNTAHRLPTSEFKSPNLIRKRSAATNRYPAKRPCYKRLLSVDEDSDGEGEGEQNGPKGSRRPSSSHELFIQQILKKPFKVPLEGYESGSNSCRSLGMRRSGLRVALHDPYSDGALVLFYPPEQTAHDQIATPKDSNKTQVSCVSTH